MIQNFFQLHGLPCGVCGHPAHHSEAYPNGVRTVHVDPKQRPCDTLPRAATNQPGRRGAEPPSVLPRAPVPARSPSSADRQTV